MIRSANIRAGVFDDFPACFDPESGIYDFLKVHEYKKRHHTGIIALHGGNLSPLEGLLLVLMEEIAVLPKK